MSAAAALLLSVTQLITPGQSIPALAAEGCSGYGTDITSHVVGRLAADQKSLDVFASDLAYQVTAVGVTGGGSSKVYTGGFTGLTAPPNRGGNTPAISGWYACGFHIAPTIQPSPTTPPRPPKPTKTPRPSETPSATDTPSETPSETPDATDTPDPTETAEPTETPSSTETSGPVPTSIPAGGPAAPSGGGTGGVLIILGVAAMAAGAVALLARRQRAHG